MEEIGLQFERAQDDVVKAVRDYLERNHFRLIEETPLRRNMTVLHAQPPPHGGTRHAPAASRPVRIFDKGPHLASIFESYFEYYFRTQRRRALLVGPTVGRWTGVLYGEKAIDVHLLRWLSRHLGCRGVGYGFVEEEEYSYIEFLSGREIEMFSSILADTDGRNYWSARHPEPPAEGRWIAAGFLKQRYQFIPGFYDLPFLRKQKPRFTCYRYSAFPDRYDEVDNYPLSAFRYFYFSCLPE
jgi:hypothetical protein